MELLIILLLVFVNGIFAMAEMSLVSARKFKLESEIKKGRSGAKKALELSEDPNRFLSTVQIGITLIGILLGVFSGENLTQDFELFLQNFQWMQPYTHNIAVGLVVVFITYLSIVLGELLPKKVAMTFPEPIAIMLAGPMSFLSRITAPFVWLLTFTNNSILRIFGIKNNNDAAVTEAEIKSMIKEGTTSGEIQQIEHEIVDRVFEFGDKKIESIMTHRRDIIAIDIEDTIEEIKNKIFQEPHSSYPVTKNNELDDIEGIVLLKDLFEGILSYSFDLQKYIKKPIYLYENTPAFKLLEMFRQERMHYALITDEYGSIKGFVTMDDVLDSLVGDITQDHQQEYSLFQRDENSWLVDGQYSFSEFLRKMQLSDEYLSEDFHTIGGFIIEQNKSIPDIGTKVTIENYTLEVIDMDGPRIDKILLIRN